MTEARTPRSSGKVRAARLTDLAALGELSRLCQSDAAETRSLGLPVSGPPIGVFSLFRLPLGAFQPNDLMYVYEDAGRLAGLLRVERETTRDEWTIVELDAVGMADAGDIRYRLVQQLLREGAKRAAARFHVACADADGNVELLMQAGFIRFGEETDPGPPGQARRCRSRGPTSAPPRSGSGRRPSWTRCRCRGCTPRSRPSRSTGSRPCASPTGSARGRTRGSRGPASRRSCASRTSRRSSRRPPDGGKDGTALDGFLQIGVAKEDQPHYLKIMARPEADTASLVDFGLGRHRGPNGQGAIIATTTGSSLPCEPMSHRSTADWRRQASTRSPVSRCS